MVANSLDEVTHEKTELADRAKRIYDGLVFETRRKGLIKVPLKSCSAINWKDNLTSRLDSELTPLKL